MNETQRNIKAYEEALPHLRERVAAVALLLLLSVCMMTSATFAWLTISRAPEVTGVNTTVAANGNLEIALVNPEGTEPAESQVGDSMAKEGQMVTLANQTWGNLINLSDESYGLEHLTLRPAQLNTAALLTTPLYGAVYGEDGRVSQLTSRFDYTSWVEPDGDVPGYFGISEEYGVRAVSSTKVEAVGADLIYVKMVDDTVAKNGQAQSMYTALASDSSYMQSLATMMGLYMTARMDADGTFANPTCKIGDIQNLQAMYTRFVEAFDAEAEALAALGNLQLFLQYGSGNYDPLEGKDIYSYASSKALKDATGVVISNLDTFIKDHNTIISDLEKLTVLCDANKDVTWLDSGMNGIVNNLVNVGLCTIGEGESAVTVNSIIAEGASGAMEYISGEHQANITNGILYNFELRTGAYIKVEKLKIAVSIKRYGFATTQSVTASLIRTTADEAGYTLFANDLAYSESLNDGTFEGGVSTAMDTYGLAIDLWVRSNAVDSYLTLEGNVITETMRDVQVTGKDANGNIVDLYTLTITHETEDGSSAFSTMDLYKGGDGNWYNADNHAIVTEEELGGNTPQKKVEDVDYVIGYEGENRVWQENEKLSTDSTTQGSGSCYVYYADTPEDQAQSLKLLEAMKVAFVDADGHLLTIADMDTDHAYAASGRVIVPLVLRSSSSISLGADEEGNEVYAITALTQNEAMRVTAIVYLEGTLLSNDEVLAAADIQGRLNIQFGSSEMLDTIDDETLETAERSVSASATPTSFNYDTATAPMTTTVSVTVTGEQPRTVTAFFLRAINATQGSRELPMSFEDPDGDGVWTAQHTFDSPGNYVLRTVRLDGVDYDLANCPTVTVEGFTVDQLTVDGAVNNHVNIMTAAGSSSVDLTLKFATNDSDKMPHTVQGRYLRADGSATTVRFTYNTTTQLWTGSAQFLTSGDYTMQYLVLDGKYKELPKSMWQTASVYLGMKVAVYTTSPTNFTYKPSEMTDDMRNLAMKVTILDNNDNEMPGLSNVKLTYGMRGSSINKMDADLSWDGSYYVGTLPVSKPGVWQFVNVTVGDNTLTTATTAPTYTILSPEPPAYYSHATAAYQYKPNKDAVMDAQITNSSAASVQAYIIKSGATEGVWVTGTVGTEFSGNVNGASTSVNHWTFKVPADANGYQDGNWQLTQLKLWDVYDTDGNQYTEESPLIIVVEDKSIVTKVVNRVNVTFPEGKSQNFTGKNFMESYTVSASGDKALYVDITDFEGKAITGVSDVQLKFKFVNGSSSTYGGYTSSSLNNATEGATITVSLTDTGSGTRFAQTTDFSFLYAGEYITDFSFNIKVSENSYLATSYSSSPEVNNLPVNAPVYTVSTATPTATISAITPTGSNATKITYTTKSLSWGRGTEPTFTAGTPQTSSFDATTNTATVYAVATADNNTQRHGGFTRPTLTVTVAGVDSGCTVSITLPGGSADAITFSRTGNGTIKNTLGKVSQIKSWTSNFVLTHTLSAYYGHGEQTITTMTVVKDGMTYTVTLPKAIVINNPSSVNQS